MSQGFCTAHGPEPAKLSELRAKTDQQLANLIQSTLDVGLRLAALTQTEASSSADAEQSLERTGQALAEVLSLLPALHQEQRRIVTPKLNELRQAMERLRRASSWVTRAAAF
ncbi:MAG TPA: hypothetical protein VL285_10975 [Bryobacteraceae bacterium]|jgi:hypothetical protein|nr:hypothetical protein [Bryobacteraceae bacterium]